MNDEIKHAFAHPEIRAEAMTGIALGEMPRDRLSVRDYIVEVEIGAFQAERDMTQRVSFNVVVEITPLPDDVDDDVDRILSYDKVTEAINFELAAERLNLLETLAERVSERILLEPQACRVFLRIEKLDRGPGALGVEIVREPAGVLGELVEDVVRPRLAFVSNAAIALAELKTRIADLTAQDAPLVLCVGMPDIAIVQVAGDGAQRRVDLLAIEQNALRVSTLVPDCAVVATRTELDWAMKNGHVCVWAPSKIVLDAVDGPQGHDGLSLARWLAAELGAVELIEL